MSTVSKPRVPICPPSPLRKKKVANLYPCYDRVRTLFYSVMYHDQLTYVGTHWQLPCELQRASAESALPTSQNCKIYLKNSKRTSKLRTVVCETNVTYIVYFSVHIPYCQEYHIGSKFSLQRRRNSLQPTCIPNKRQWMFTMYVIIKKIH